MGKKKSIWEKKPGENGENGGQGEDGGNGGDGGDGSRIMLYYTKGSETLFLTF